MKRRKESWQKILEVFAHAKNEFLQYIDIQFHFEKDLTPNFSVAKPANNNIKALKYFLTSILFNLS